MRTKSPPRDAVRVARHMGLRVLTKMTTPGPVLVSPAEKALYFFVPAGSVASCSLSGITVQGAESIVLPPADRIRPPGPYWLVNHASGFVLADELLSAISITLSETGRPS